jgi:hypothetical protein
MRSYHVREDCRLCGAALPLDNVVTFSPTALANEYLSSRAEAKKQDRFPLYLKECTECGHVQLPVVVDPARLFRSYAYQSGTSPVFRRHLEQFRKDVPCKGFVLEIASNDGTLLKGYKQDGARILGIEPATNLAHGYDCMVEFWNRELAQELMTTTKKHPDLIVALNVFAHVDDLRDFAMAVQDTLALDGQFVFEVGYLPDVIGGGLIDVIYHEHLSYHSLRPLVRFFESMGMRMVDAHRVDSQGGSIRCFVKHNGQRSRRLNELLEAEKCLEDVMAPKLLQEIAAHFKQKLQDLLIPLQKPLAIYGAPAKLTTLMTAAKLDPHWFSCVFDDNPLKDGKFTPGTGIPIQRPSGSVVGRTLLLASWNFADEIISRNMVNRWIVPLPVPRIVDKRMSSLHSDVKR